MASKSEVVNWHKYDYQCLSIFEGASTILKQFGLSIFERPLNSPETILEVDSGPSINNLCRV
jgi:hypothetical protein